MDLFKYFFSIFFNLFYCHYIFVHDKLQVYFFFIISKILFFFKCIIDLIFLKKENPALTKAISCFSNTILEVNEFIKNYETNFIKRQQMVYNNNDYFAKIDLGEFLNETTFLQTQILFRMLKPFSLSKECILDTINHLNKILFKI